MKNVCVIFGGTSTEHEVSRISASNLIKNLDKKKYSLTVIEISKKNEYFLYEYQDDDSFFNKIIANDNDLVKKQITPDIKMFVRMGIDVVFPIIHGTIGEDGKLQGFLELCDIPYVGCDVLSSAVCMDKVLCKDILSKNGIAVMIICGLR